MPIAKQEQSPLHSSLPSEPILCDMVDLFVDEMPRRVEWMQASFDRRDWGALECAARQLASVSGSYGFEVLRPFAAELERAIRQRATVDEIAAALETLVAQCGRVAGTVNC